MVQGAEAPNSDSGRAEANNERDVQAKVRERRGCFQARRPGGGQTFHLPQGADFAHELATFLLAGLSRPGAYHALVLFGIFCAFQ